MGRMRGEHRRLQILAVAAEQFAQNGYHGTTTAELARAAGVTPPVLYRHVKGKQELFLLVLDAAAAEAAVAWPAALEAGVADRDATLFENAPESARTFERLVAGVMDAVSRDIVLADAVARTMRLVVVSIASTGIGLPKAWLALRWRLGAVHLRRVASPQAIEASERLLADMVAAMDQPASGGGTAPPRRVDRRG